MQPDVNFASQPYSQICVHGYKQAMGTFPPAQQQRKALAAAAQFLDSARQNQVKTSSTFGCASALLRTPRIEIVPRACCCKSLHLHHQCCLTILGRVPRHGALLTLHLPCLVAKGNLKLWWDQAFSRFFVGCWILLQEVAGSVQDCPGCLQHFGVLLCGRRGDLLQVASERLFCTQSPVAKVTHPT